MSGRGGSREQKNRAAYEASYEDVQDESDSESEFGSDSVSGESSTPGRLPIILELPFTEQVLGSKKCEDGQSSKRFLWEKPLQDVQSQTRSQEPSGAAQVISTSSNALKVSQDDSSPSEARPPSSDTDLSSSSDSSQALPLCVVPRRPEEMPTIARRCPQVGPARKTSWPIPSHILRRLELEGRSSTESSDSETYFNEPEFSIPSETYSENVEAKDGSVFPSLVRPLRLEALDEERTRTIGDVQPDGQSTRTVACVPSECEYAQTSAEEEWVADTANPTSMDHMLPQIDLTVALEKAESGIMEALGKHTHKHTATQSTEFENIHQVADVSVIDETDSRIHKTLTGDLKFSSLEREVGSLKPGEMQKTVTAPTEFVTAELPLTVTHKPHMMPSALKHECSCETLLSSKHDDVMNQQEPTRTTSYDRGGQIVIDIPTTPKHKASKKKASTESSEAENSGEVSWLSIEGSGETRSHPTTSGSCRLMTTETSDDGSLTKTKKRINDVEQGLTDASTTSPPQLAEVEIIDETNPRTHITSRGSRKSAGSEAQDEGTPTKTRKRSS